MKPIAILALLFIACLSGGASARREYYVAVNGSDADPGTKAKPFATLERARDAIREIKKARPLPDIGVTVWIRGGVYHRGATFDLTPEDSGTETSPIVYRACEGEEVRLTGGREVKGFKRVTDPEILGRLDESAPSPYPLPRRGGVLQADLKAQGIADYGEMKSRGFGRSVVPAGLEVFFQDRPMTLARWPNDDWAGIADVPAGATGGKFAYEGERPKRWSKADDIWVHGYWTWDWADSYEKVKSVDTEAREISTVEPHGIYGYRKGARYCALNLLEELDRPGEWYLDRRTGILYFWPPGPLAAGKVYVSILDEPVISLLGTSHITLRGLTVESARGSGIEMSGGTHNLIAGCTIRNIGTYAARINGGTQNGILSCDIYETGDGGIQLQGGDRKTLTPAGNYAKNNHIHHFSRWSKTYRPAILVQGVGNIVAHNLMHSAPHSAVIYNGNEHIMEFNEVHHVCMDTSDAGGFYMGRDFTERGNVIRYNYLHHMGTADVRAIYIDDCASDVRVFGNILYKAKMGVCIGGGRDNVVENNIFVGCQPSIHVDARGLNWAKPTVDQTMKERLEAMNFRRPPYSERYPELLTLYDDDPGAPKYNVIERNISIGGKWLNLNDAAGEKTISIRDNLVDADPGFVDAPNGDFQLRDDSPAWKLGFKRIPMERIGLYVDEYRKTLPAREEKPSVKKLGTLDCDMVEATPIVFKGRLYRFEYVRNYYKGNKTGKSYFRFIDVESGEPTAAFAEGYHLGSAHVQGDTVYVYGVNTWGGTEVRAFWSKDLRDWQSRVALDLPGWGIFNNSVCKGRDRYIMAIEIDKPAEETGVAFTIRFAESKDLLDWKLTPSECVFSKDCYTACPALRFLDGRYYMIYLEARPGPTYEPHIVRSRDLVNWESSPLNPVMRYSVEDKFIANPGLSQEQRDGIMKAVDINNSDVDLCEFKGKTIIYYSWGNQQGIEHLAEAVYPGTLAMFLRSFFP